MIGGMIGCVVSMGDGGEFGVGCVQCKNDGGTRYIQCVARPISLLRGKSQRGYRHASFMHSPIPERSAGPVACWTGGIRGISGIRRIRGTQWDKLIPPDQCKHNLIMNMR